MTGKWHAYRHNYVDFFRGLLHKLWLKVSCLANSKVNSENEIVPNYVTPIDRFVCKSQINVFLNTNLVIERRSIYKLEYFLVILV